MKEISRRKFIQSTIALSAVIALKPDLVLAKDQPFKLPQLDYALNSLEPYIDTETMGIHYSKHHQSYIDKLNQEIEKDSKLTSLSLEDINSRALSLPEVIRNNAGGHYNHSFFWKLMSPKSSSTRPDSELLKQITTDFGSIQMMQNAVNAAALQRFGSGWAWLIKTSDGKLSAISTANQDNPLMAGLPQTGKPILAIDVWEHAYYLKYRNKRTDYLTNWWSVVNWEQINKNFNQSCS